MNVFDYIEKELDRIEVGYTSYDGTRLTMSIDDVRELVENLRMKLAQNLHNACTDPIEREDVVNILHDAMQGRSESEENLIGEIVSKVDLLPPAQPETNCSEIPNNWIPCSERLPEGEYVLISKKPTKISGDKWCVTIAIRMADPRSRKVNWRDIGFGVIQDNEVIAWMPLPEPYRGEEK